MKQMFNKQHKYSIRKLSIGICSAVIGFSFLSAGTAYANTDEGTGNPQTGQTQPPGEQGGDTSGSNAPGAAAGTTIAPLPESETPNRSEEKNLAQGVTGEIQAPRGLRTTASDSNISYLTDGNESNLWKTDWNRNKDMMFPTTVSVPLGEDAHVDSVDVVFEQAGAPFRFSVTVTDAQNAEREIHTEYKDHTGRLPISRVTATVPEDLKEGVRKVNVKFLDRNPATGAYSLPSPALRELRVTGYEHLANYDVVREAIGRVPADLSGYTESSVNNLVQARNAVELNKKRSEQSVVNGYADAINLAIRSLALKQPPVTYTRLTEDATTNKAQLDLLSDVNSAGNKAKIREKLVIPTDKTATIEEITPANTTDEVGQKTVLAKVKYEGIKPVTTAEGSSINNGWANLNNAHESVLSDDANTFWGSKWPDADTNGENNRETMTLTFDQPTEITHIRYRPSYVKTENGKILKGHIMYEKEDGVWERLDLKSVAPVSGGRTPIRIDGQENFYVESATDTSYHDLVTFTVEPVVAKRIRLFGTKTHHKDVPALYDKIVSVSTFYALGNHTDIIEVPVEVVDNRSEHEKYAPQAVQNKVYNLGARIAATANEDNASAKELISEADRLPQDTKFTFKDNVSPDTATATAEGINRTVTVLVTYPGDPVPDEVEVNYTVVDNRPSPVQKAEFVRGEHEIVVTLPQDARAGDNVVMLASRISVPVTVNGSGGVVPTVTITMSPNTTLREDRQFVQIERAGVVSAPVYISPVRGEDKYQPSVSEGSVIFTAQTEVTEEVSDQVKAAISAKVTPQKRADNSASGRVSLPADFDVAALLAAPKTETVSVTVTYADDTTDVVTVPVIVKPGRYTQLKPEATTNKAQLDLLSDINSDDNKRKLLEKLQLPEGKTAEVTLVTPKTPEANTTAEVGDKTVTAKVLYTNIPISVASVDVKSTNTDWGASNNKQHVLDENNGTYWASLWELGRNSEADREYLTLTLSEPATISEIKYQQRHSNASTNGRIRKGYIEYRLDDRDTWKKVDLTAISGGGRNEIDSEKNFLVPEATANNKVLTLTATAFKAGQIRLVGVETDGGPTGGNQMVTVATFLPVSPQVIETIDVPVEVVDNRPDNEKYEPTLAEGDVARDLTTSLSDEAATALANDIKAKVTPQENSGGTVTLPADFNAADLLASAGTKPVVVTVTYADRTADTKTVNVVVTDRRSDNEKYEPTLAEGDVARDLTTSLSDEAATALANDIKAKVTPQENSGGTVTLPADFNAADLLASAGTKPVVVTVTYADRTADTKTVNVVVTDRRSDNEKYEPTLAEGDVARDLTTSLSDEAATALANDIKAKVTPQENSGGTVTLPADFNAADLLASAGTKPVVVTVTYADRTADTKTVNVVVTDRRSDNEKYEPTLAEGAVARDLTTSLSDEAATALANDIKAKVTPQENSGGTVTLPADFNAADLLASAGTKPVVVTVTYADRTADTKTVNVVVTDRRSDNEKYEPTLAEGDVARDLTTSLSDEAATALANDIKAKVTPQENSGGTVTLPADFNAADLLASAGTKPVVVTVTYADRTADTKTVNVVVTDRRSDNEKYEPTLAEGDVARDLTTSLSDEAATALANDIKAKVTPQENSGGTVTLPADFNAADLLASAGTKPVVVTVTYADRTADTKTVNVVVTDRRSDNEKYEPTLAEGDVARDLTTSLSSEAATALANDIKAKVTPQENSGGTVTLPADFNAADLLASAGTKPVVVTVTYADRTADTKTVNVVVTDRRSDNEKYEPTLAEGDVARDLTTSLSSEAATALANDIKAKVTPQENSGGTVTLPADFNAADLLASAGTKPVVVTVTYADRTADTKTVNVVVTDRRKDKDKYQPTVANDLTVKKNAQLTAEAILAKVTPQDGSNGTKAIQGDLPSTATVGTVTATVRVTYADQSVDDVSVQVTVEELDSAKYTATGGTLIRTLNQALTEDDVKAAVTVPAKAGQVTKELVGSLPSTDARGEKKATVKVTYGDQSSEKVEVTVQVVDESNREDLLALIRRQQEELNRIRHEKEEATEERNKAIDEKVQAEIDKRLALAAVEIAKQEADSKVTMAKQEADSKVKIAEQEAAHAKGQADAAKKESDQAKADAEKAREDARQAKLLADDALLAHQSGLLLLVEAQRAKESALEELDQAKNDLKEAAKDVTLAKEEANKAKDALAQANRDNAGQVAAAQQAQQAAEAKLQQAQDFLVEKTKAKDEADQKAAEATKEADKLKGQVANLEAAKTTAEGAAQLAEAAKTKAEKALEEAETAQKQAEDKLKQALADKEQAERNRDNAIAQANREKEDAVARANREKETALADAKREKEDAVAQANREKEAAVAQANRERDTALADAKREKETALADAKREKEDAVAQANREKEAAVAQANRERDTALADAKREKEDAVAQANREKEAAVAQANRERDTALADAKREKEDAVAQANREKEAAVAQANRERDTTLADAKREKEAAQAELDRVQKAQADAEKRLKEAETAKTQAEQAKAQAEREKNDADTAKRLAADKAAAAERERLQAEKDLQAAQKAQAEAEKRLVAAELERAQALEAERAKAAKALEDANNKWLAAEQALATAKVAKAQVDGQLAAAEVARARAEQDRIQALDAASRAQEAAKLAQEQAEAKARAAEEALLVAKANLAIAEATKTAAENRLLILEQERTEAQRHYEAALASAQSDKTEAERKLLAAQAAIDGIRLELTAAELAKEDAQARFVQAQTDQATAQHEKNNALAAQAEAERAKADLEAKLRDLERVKAEELAVANHEKEVALAALAAAEREAAQALAEKEAALLALAEKEDVTPTPAPEAKPETSSVPTAEPRPNSVPTTSTNEVPGTASPEATAPVTPDSRPVETTGSAEPVAAETPETLAASARRELIDPRTDVRVQLESGETAPITGLTVRHRETNDVATPAVLAGQDYDLFDIVPVDQNGQPVAITKPALVLLPLDAGKAVEKVFYLPEGGSPDERVFTMTTITKADGQLVPAVAFIAEHFSDYGIVYKSTVQAATPVASSAATEQPVTDQPVANKPQVTEPATTKADQPVVVARLTPRVPAAAPAPASATQTASSTSLPETSDSQSGVVSLGVVGLMSALGLMGLKRRHND